MQAVNSQADFEQLLQRDEAVLYIYVDWSSYARDGRQIVEKVESLFDQGGSPTFWLADLSNANSPGFFIGDWLRARSDRGTRMFPASGMGNGSLVWIKKGEVVDFAMSALHLKAEGIIRKTERASGHKN